MDSGRPAAPALAEVAGEEPDQSAQVERDAVGDRPDTGGTVPSDDAQ